jgi:hypothetical protein
MLAASAAYGQLPGLGLPVAKPIETTFKGSFEDIWKPLHIHTIPYSCKGKPDQVYGRQGTVYYACVNGKDICSEEKNVSIHYKLIEQFEAKMREHDIRIAAGREQLAKAFANAKPAPARRTVEVAPATAADLSSPPAPPGIADELVKGIAVGTTRAELIEKFGEPHMKITGDVEYYTYMLASGNSAQLELDGGKLTRVEFVRVR